MLKYLFCCLLLLCLNQAIAQIPRNAAGQFEYSQTITVDNAPLSTLRDRAIKFFSRPMLVHWDSIHSIQGEAPSGDGYVEIGISSGLFGSKVKVGLQCFISSKNNGYQYSIRKLVVRDKNGKQYPLEEQPETLKYKHYDQLLNRTHRYLQRVIGFLKREMNGFQ